MISWISDEFCPKNFIAPKLVVEKAPRSQSSWKVCVLQFLHHTFCIHYYAVRSVSELPCHLSRQLTLTWYGCWREIGNKKHIAELMFWLGTKPCVPRRTQQQSKATFLSVDMDLSPFSMLFSFSIVCCSSAWTWMWMVLIFIFINIDKIIIFRSFFKGNSQGKSITAGSLFFPWLALWL